VLRFLIAYSLHRTRTSHTKCSCVNFNTSTHQHLRTLIVHTFNGDRIDTKTQSRWSGTIRENVAQMTVTNVAHHFNARHSKRGVLFIFDNIILNRCSEAWPPGSRFKFLSGVKQRGATTTAGIQARLMRLTILSSKRSLSTLPPCDVIFFRRKLFLPFLIGFLNPSIRRQILFGII